MGLAQTTEKLTMIHVRGTSHVLGAVTSVTVQSGETVSIHNNGTSKLIVVNKNGQVLGTIDRASNLTGANKASSNSNFYIGSTEVFQKKL